MCAKNISVIYLLFGGATDFTTLELKWFSYVH